MTTLLFTDLDDTLFQSRKKCGDDPMLKPMARLVDGTYFSFATQKQVGLLKFLGSDNSVIIPVTARSKGAFERVDIKFDNFAVVQHGGLILNADKTVNDGWYQIMKNQLSNYKETFVEVQEEIKAIAKELGVDITVKIQSEEGLDFYVLVKNNDKSTLDLGLFGDRLNTKFSKYLGFYIHQNGNNWALIPIVVSKKNAVRYLLDVCKLMYESTLTIGFGDSMTDIPFMSLCDYTLFPNGSQISKGISK